MIHDALNVVKSVRERPVVMMAAVAAFLGTVGHITFLNENEPTAGQLEALRYEETQRQARIEKKAAKCRILKKNEEQLRPSKFNRRGILNDLMKLATCTDPNSEDFNLDEVCTQIEKGLRDKHSKFWHPVLHPFYVMLYQEIDCIRKDPRQNASQEVLKLFDTLDNSDIIRRYQLLDPSKSINQLCRPALDFAELSKGDIATIQRYIVGKNAKGQLETSPYLKDLMKAAEETFEKNNPGKKLTPEESEKTLQTILGYITSAAAHPVMACLNPEAAIATYNLGAKTPITPKIITEKRRLALPGFRELLDLIRNDTDKKAADEVGTAISNMARRMAGLRQ